MKSDRLPDKLGNYPAMQTEVAETATTPCDGPESHRTETSLPTTADTRASPAEFAEIFSSHQARHVEHGDLTDIE